MADIDFYQYYSYIPVPKELKDDLIDNQERPLTKLEDLSHINIFLGTNNSGKSRIIREIIRDNIDPIYFQKEIQEDIKTQIKNAREDFLNLISRTWNKFDQSFHIASASKELYLEAKDYGFDLKDFDERFNSDFGVIKIIQNILDLLKEIKPLTYTRIVVPNGHNIGFDQNTSNIIKEDFRMLLSRLHTSMKSMVFKEKYFRIYIPAQRSLQTIFKDAKLSENIGLKYKFQLKNTLELKKGNDTHDGVILETGESFYDEIHDNLTSGLKNRTKVQEFEEFLSKNFFENEPIDLIPFTKDIKEIHI